MSSMRGSHLIYSSYDFIQTLHSHMHEIVEISSLEMKPLRVVAADNENIQVCRDFLDRAFGFFSGRYGQSKTTKNSGMERHKDERYVDAFCTHPLNDVLELLDHG